MDRRTAPSRVLVVDDDAMVAEVVATYLVRAGFDIERAGDGASALEKAAARPPDLVVLDLTLPDIDGLEVCRRLRQAREDLPVLILTARGDEDDRVLGLQRGADDYVTKPFSPRELVLRVQSVLRRSAPAPARGRQRHRWSTVTSPWTPSGTGASGTDASCR